MLLRSGIQHDRTRGAADRASIMRNAPLLGNVERSDVHVLAESAAAPSQRMVRAGCAAVLSSHLRKFATVTIAQYGSAYEL